jgi:hypothetical protein
MSSKRKDSKSRLTKVPITVYLEPEQAEALRALSEATHVPQQAYMRAGLDWVLEQVAKKKPWS